MKNFVWSMFRLLLLNGLIVSFLADRMQAEAIQRFSGNYINAYFDEN